MKCHTKANDGSSDIPHSTQVVRQTRSRLAVTAMTAETAQVHTFAAQVLLAAHVHLFTQSKEALHMTDMLVFLPRCRQEYGSTRQTPAPAYSIASWTLCQRPLRLLRSEERQASPRMHRSSKRHRALRVLQQFVRRSR